ncbi:PP2C family protein-serine/threonine phosphatase [Flindersiella endophytica]
MTVVFRYAARSHEGLGRGRELNEDSGYASPRLLAVADGMGGHAHGELASAITTAAIQEIDGVYAGRNADPLGSLVSGVRTANARLGAWVRSNPQSEGMGTTLTAVLLYGAKSLALIHVGDSRAYLLRHGALRRLTRDHTVAEMLIDERRASREDAERHPQGSMLTRALQGMEGPRARPDLYTELVEPGDRVLLCSDGLMDAPVPETQIGETLEQHSDPDRAAAALVDLALRAGAPDNVTCIVADITNSTSKRKRSVTPIVVGSVADPRLAGVLTPPQPGQAPGPPPMGPPSQPAPQQVQQQGQAQQAQPAQQQAPQQAPTQAPPPLGSPNGRSQHSGGWQGAPT